MASSLSSSPYPQNSGGSNYSPSWGNQNSYNNNNNNGYQNGGYQPSQGGGYYYPQGSNMRQSIMREQEQRRLQYQQQMQQQQQNRAGGNQQNGAQAGQTEVPVNQNEQAQSEPASESDASVDASSTPSDEATETSIKSVASHPELTAANIKAADLQAQPSKSPSGTQPCTAGSSSSSWGHPVWWGWSDNTGCGQ
ncbi:hypothetical protein PCANC_01401 [Puccinia coronata f. sp. avenae]|uniref:Uncharacterized protein n=1 Tax=Puccinia coronata f. sp. avenae TaxID=200324 RepID=A0A2N5W683_9BASI|nr:hypothetical protein PCANC_01401 [Puccinia coronata f. sp. avenae]